MKPIIRKQDACWVVTRPGYGFRPDPTTEEFGSWKAAVASLRGGPASAGAQVERDTFVYRPGYWGPPRGTIRMEGT